MNRESSVHIVPDLVQSLEGELNMQRISEPEMAEGEGWGTHLDEPASELEVFDSLKEEGDMKEPDRIHSVDAEYFTNHLAAFISNTDTDRRDFGQGGSVQN